MAKRTAKGGAGKKTAARKKPAAKKPAKRAAAKSTARKTATKGAPRGEASPSVAERAIDLLRSWGPSRYSR